MVKKLFKHEFLAYARIMSIIYIILLSFALFGRVLMFFENDSTVYTIISVFSNISYTLSILAALSFSFALGVVRFYKNLFTCEGYLTFTLPITPAQHIWVKSLTAISFNLITWVVILISGAINTAGEVFAEILKAIGYLLGKLYEIAKMNTVFFGMELGVLLLVSSFSGILLYYTFISIGQLSKKNRVLAAVGSYFVFQVATQIISSVFAVVVSIMAENGALDKLGEVISINITTTIHIAFCGLILLSAIFALALFFVIKHIITKKLNLE